MSRAVHATTLERSTPSVAVPSVLEATALVRRFGDRAAVDDVSLALASGECLALYGPNGAGKTTLLRLLSGLLKPTSGDARVSGVALRGDADARARVGLISHQTMLYPALTARENVEFAARLYGVGDPRRAADEALERLRVRDRGASRVRELSRGLQQRVSIARAIVHRPPVVLLDEPYTGLDAAGAAALTQALGDMRAEGGTLVLVTHNVDEGLALASHVAVMANGRLVQHQSRSEVDARRLAVELRTIAGDATR